MSSSDDDDDVPLGQLAKMKPAPPSVVSSSVILPMTVSSSSSGAKESTISSITTTKSRKRTNYNEESEEEEEFYEDGDYDDDEDIAKEAMLTKKKKKIKKEEDEHHDNDGTASKKRSSAKKSAAKKEKKAVPIKKEKSSVKVKKTTTEKSNTNGNDSNKKVLSSTKKGGGAAGTNVLKAMDKAERISHGMQAYLWWNANDPPKGCQWSKMETAGVSFPDPYIPHNVKMLYDGKESTLSPVEEEAATFFAAMDPDGMHLGNAKTAPIFIKNFMADFKSILGKNHVIKEYAKCDFGPIRRHLDEQKLVKKAITDGERKTNKTVKDAAMFKFGYALVDGHLEKVGNYNSKCLFYYQNVSSAVDVI